MCLAAHPRAARGQTTYKIAEGRLRIESISAQAQPANPVVPKNTMSALRVSVRAGERELIVQLLARAETPVVAPAPGKAAGTSSRSRPAPKGTKRKKA